MNDPNYIETAIRLSWQLCPPGIVFGAIAGESKWKYFSTPQRLAAPAVNEPIYEGNT